MSDEHYIIGDIGNTFPSGDYTQPSNYGWWNVVSGKATEMTTQNQFNHDEAQLANAFSAQEAEKNREFQEKMANTEYQRAVADMRAAGINPLNSPISGSSPTGSMASGHQATATSSPGSDFGNFLQTLAGVIASVVTTSGKVASAEKIASEQIASKELIAQKTLDSKALSEAGKAKLAKDLLDTRISATSALQADRLEHQTELNFKAHRAALAREAYSNGWKKKGKAIWRAKDYKALGRAYFKDESDFGKKEPEISQEAIDQIVKEFGL